MVGVLHVRGVREPDEVRHAVDPFPRHGRAFRVELGQQLDVRAVGLDRRMAGHAGCLGRIAGCEAGIGDGMAVSALQAQRDVRLVAVWQRLLNRYRLGLLTDTDPQVPARGMAALRPMPIPAAEYSFRDRSLTILIERLSVRHRWRSGSPSW